MSFILAILQKIDDMFASPHLPLDTEYSYAARLAEAERQRQSCYMPIDVFRR
jgi:hypothetical protein